MEKYESKEIAIKVRDAIKNNMKSVLIEISQCPRHVRSVMNGDCFCGYEEGNIKLIEKFFGRFEDFLLIVGVLGCGKTQLMIEILRRFITTREPKKIIVKKKESEGATSMEEKWQLPTVAMLDEHVLLDGIKATWDRPEAGTESKWLKTVKEIDLLFIDDMEAKDEAPWVYQRYYEILDYRYKNLLPTVISTDLMLISDINPKIAHMVLSGTKISLVGRGRK